MSIKFLTPIWLHEKLSVDCRGDVRVTNIVRVATITALIVAKKLPFSQIDATHCIEDVNDVFLWVEAGILSDLRHKVRQKIVDNMLIEEFLPLTLAVAVEGRRHHEVDFRLTRKCLEGADELPVVLNVLFFIPAFPGIVRAEHDDDDVGI